MKVHSHPYKLEMEHPFGISRSVHSFQETFIVELEQDGVKGYGEATQNTYYGASIQNMQDGLKILKKDLEKYAFTTPEDFWDHFLFPRLKNFRFLMAALDEAANDLYGKMQNKALYQLWGYHLDNLPLSTYTIALDTLEKMKEKLLEKPWPVYKIKLGTDHDIEIITALREITDSPFRVDANTAWEVEQTIEYSKILKELGVEFIEQPFKANNLA